MEASSDSQAAIKPATVERLLRRTLAGVFGLALGAAARLSTSGTPATARAGASAD